MRKEGKSSEDVCMIFDEMYLQKSQEYFLGEMIGCDDEVELYKGIVCFMIDTLKESIPYVIKSLPEINIDANWLKTELLGSSNRGFRVRGIVFDNHPSNVSSFNKMLEHFNHNLAELYMLHKYATQVQKNLPLLRRCPFNKKGRNNLFKCKRFVFSQFEFSGFKDPINVPGGEIAWNLS